MANPKAAWGVEVGTFAIKALRLERDGGNVNVSDFAVIPHKKVLTTPDLDQHEMMRLSLGQFISQKDLENEHLVMSVPGHAAFARFAKLPPVDPKKVPDIVRFEAVQQIPFPIDQVEWDYQTFTMPDSPEIEVGIFAITRERIQQMLGLYAELGMTPEAMTLSPVSVFNAMSYDQNLGEHKGPIIYLDIGTQATDVIIAEEGRCWIRTFPLGGTHFTEAIAQSFKLSYSKAEKLKHDAATSKYAKQIMQAMRPVFSDLLQDLQRSIGYYQSLHREHDLSLMVGLGSTFKIPGLRKFLGQQLQINVLRLDEYKRIAVAGREAASFAENAVNFATAYGLALQGVGLAPISANLVPVPVLREQVWHTKTKWFAAAAAVAIVASGMTFVRPLMDRAQLHPGGEPPIVGQVLSRGNQYRSEYQQLQSQNSVGATATNMRDLLDYRRVYPFLVTDVTESLTSTNPQSALLSGDIDAIRAIPPAERRLVELQQFSGAYIYDASSQSRRIGVTLHVRLSHDRPIDFLNGTVAAWLRENAERDGWPYRILPDTISLNPDRLQTVNVSGTGEADVPSGGRPGGDSGPAWSGGGDRTPPSGGRPGGGRRPPGGGTLPGGPGGGRSAPGGGTLPGGPGGGPIGVGAGDPPDFSAGDPGSGAGSGSRSGGAAHGDLEALAPIPKQPLPFPPNSTYYIATVTFEIELLAPAQAAPAGVARSDRHAAEDASS